MNKELFTLDRLAGDTARLIAADGGVRCVPRAALAADAQEGMLLALSPADGLYHADAEATRLRQQQLRARVQHLLHPQQKEEKP